MLPICCELFIFIRAFRFYLFIITNLTSNKKKKILSVVYVYLSFLNYIFIKKKKNFTAKIAIQRSFILK